MQLGSLRRTALYPGLSASGLCPHTLPNITCRGPQTASPALLALSSDAENLGATGQGGNHGPSDCSDARGSSSQLAQRAASAGDAVWPWCDQLAPRSLNSSPASTPPPRVLPCWVLASGGVGGGERNSYLLLESHPGWLLPTALTRRPGPIGGCDRQG